jgi:AcrR family transcriptional regulator
MRNAKQDRRSQRTRRLLSSALIELMVQKRYDEITVQEIIDRANIGRSTFYAHYLDKDDLLVSDFTRVLDRLIQHVYASSKPSSHPTSGLTPFFEHVRSHYHLYRALVRGGGIDLLYKKGYERLRAQIEQHLEELLPMGEPPALPLPLVADYAAGAILNLLKWWLEHELHYTPEQMNSLFLQLVWPGVQRSLQLPESLVS